MALSTPRFDGELLSADEAAARLGVRKATLYAYVSRGLLTSVPDAQDPRCSRYASFEIDRMSQPRRTRAGLPPSPFGLGRAQRAGRSAAPPGTLYEGLALVDTALAGVVDGRILLRGHALEDWACHATVEDTAALLWDAPPAVAFGRQAPVLPPAWLATAAGLRQADAATRTVALWSLAMPHLNGSARLQGDALAAALGEHLRVVVACGLGQPPSAAPLHLQVARAWRVPARHHDAVRQMLVLSADFTGNLMSLAGRMVASVQGSLAASLLATLGYGFIRLSGGEFEACEALFDELQASGHPATVAAAYRARGEALPGFHHNLFPAGDPRGRALLELAGRHGSPAPGWVRAMQGTQPLHPTLDFGLVAARRAIGAPRHGAFSVNQLGRCVGMLAQAVEQRAVGQRMWVQSRYVGPALRSPGRSAPSAPDPAPVPETRQAGRPRSVLALSRK